MTAVGYTGGSGGNLVTSVFSRQGAVTAQSGDYTAAQVGALPIAGGTLTGAVRPAVVTLTDAATIAVDAALGNHFQVTIAGNRTLGNPTNAVDGQKLVFEIVQGSGGSHTLALDTKFNVGADVTITLSTVAGKKDFLGVVYDLTNDRFDVLAFVAGY
jgi:hypothetical protein